MKALWVIACIGAAFDAADNVIEPGAHWAWVALSALAVVGWLFAASRAWRQPVDWF
jgi:hypothetical protein